MLSERESWLLDFAGGDDDPAGFVRLELRPDEGVAWYWAYLVHPGFDGVVVVRDHEVPLPRQGLELRAEGLWAELYCETPGEHWTFGLEAFGVRLDAPEDARHGEIGERLPVGLDLEWETEHLVHGDVLVGRERYSVSLGGRFTITTGPTDWHALVEPCSGAPLARVLIPVGAGHLERALCASDDGARWKTTSVSGSASPGRPVQGFPDARTSRPS